MKVPPTFRRRQKGVALILVLSILVLLTAVVVAFFTNATTDLTNSKSFSDASRVRLLADSAVNVVEGQIRAGTQGGTPAAPQAWASQPGMIRTYDDQGKAVSAFKLYSSDIPQVNLTAGPPDFTLDVPDDWNAHPSDFVDLNTPTLSSVSADDPDGTIPDPKDTHKKYSARYPIIDGNNLTANPGSLGGLTYFAVDASGNTVVPSVEGFSVTPPKSYASGPPIASNNNPVPMPVRWLYVLQNGQLEARDPAHDFKIADASKKNPVIGRIAYWTDDDTCKLNINTASEGNQWDRPRARNVTELAYGFNIPAQNEFQMFPGHPSKTALSTVFGAFWQVPLWLTSSNYKQLLPYYDLTPRVTEGRTYGSAGATQNTGAISITGIPYDSDRLYSSVDELMFNQSFFTAKTPPNRGTRSATSSLYPAPLTNPITSQFLETTRFFLTASNRAPEVTLFNTPRVSLWPLQANLYSRSAKDRLLAFCATVPPGTISSTASSDPNASKNLYAFQRLTAFTEGTSANGNTVGYEGGKASSDSPTLDFSTANASGVRNNALYSYLQSMMRANVPGLGGSFAQKYGTSTSNQLLTEMVDLLRAGLNTAGNPVPGGPPGGNATPMYSYTTEGQTMPLIPPPGSAGDGTRGLGRYCTITEAAIDFFRCNDPKADPAAPIQIGAVLILQPFSTTPGYSSLRPSMQIEVSGLEQFTISDPNTPGFSVNLGMPPPPLTNIVDSFANYNQTEFGGMDTSFYYSTNGRQSGQKQLTAGAATSDMFYPFFNTPSIVKGAPGAGNLPPTATSFNFNEGKTFNLTVKIYSNPNPALIPRELVQTLTIPFPSCLNLPIPTYNSSYPVSVTNTNPAGAIFQARVKNADIIDFNDVVRSMVVNVNGPSKGDLRIIAGLKDVPSGSGLPSDPSSYFATHPMWDFNSNKSLGLIDPGTNHAVNWRFAHSLKTGDDPGNGTLGWYDYTGATASKYLSSGGGIGKKSSYTGTLVSNLPAAPNSPPYGPQGFPAVPIGLQGAKLTVGATSYDGDWDTGQGSLEDGPYINKPDEVNGQDGSFSVYYERKRAGNEKGNTYSPNRQISSAVSFGSLPTGIDPSAPTSAKPWQTLLFTPYPAAGPRHPGFGVSNAGAAPNSGIPAPPYSTVPDYAVLDMFTMPIVEPYALSEPLSTQGKVNMNYQIAPFIYIKRDTAVQAVLKSTNLMAIPATISTLTFGPNGAASPTGGYKSTNGAPYQFRYAINASEGNGGTLKAFEDRFASGDIFRSASEICEIPLFPKQFPTGSGQSQSYDSSGQGIPTSYSGLQSFWNADNGARLSGDNVREDPYGDLYPRLTTKSNTFTVHVRVQTVKKNSLTGADTFIDPADPLGDPVTKARDTVTAEYRGSYQIERYVDPNVTTTGNSDPAKNFPDYAVDGIKATSLSNFYKFHTIGVKQF